MSAALAGVMSGTVAGFRLLHPWIDIQLTEIPMDEIPGRLLDRQLDVAYVRPAMPYPDQIVLRPGPLIAVLASVSLGETVAVIPAELCACVSLPKVVYRPLTGKPIRSELALLSRRNEPSGVVQTFLQYACDGPKSSFPVAERT